MINEISTYTQLKISGDIERENFTEVLKIISQKIQSSDLDLVIDLKETIHIYSFGFSILIRTKKILEQKERKLYLINVQPQLLKYFDESGLKDLFHIYSDQNSFEKDYFNVTKSSAEPAEAAEIKLIVNGEIRSKKMVIVHLQGMLCSIEDNKRLELGIEPYLGFEKILFQLKHLSYLDSLGIRKIINVSKKLKSEKKNFRLCEPNLIVRDIFDKLNLGLMVEIFPTQQEALQNWK